MHIAGVHKYHISKHQQPGDGDLMSTSFDLAAATAPLPTVRRLSSWIERAGRSTDPETLALIASEPDEVTGIVKLLERFLVESASEASDPLRRARLRGVRARAELIAAAGGVLRLKEAAERLGVSPQAVTGRRQRGTILAVELPNGEAAYPVIQFGESGLLDGLPRVLAAFDGEPPGWTRLNVLLGPSKKFEGKSAFDLLMDGRVDDAAEVAASYGRGA